MIDEFMNSLEFLSTRDPDRLVFPAPWVGHIPFAFWLIGALQPRIFVELGTHTGNSYFAFCQAIAASEGLATRAYAVDTWQGDAHAGSYGNEVFDELSRYHQRYERFSRLLRTTFDAAVADFSDGSIDLLHIDGLHTYEAVKHDFETWKPKLSDRAVVVFHDTAVRERDFGVHEYWSEITKIYPGFEFFHSNGLGVLLIGSMQSCQALVDAAQSDEKAEELRNRFEALGRGIERKLELNQAKDMLLQRTEELRQRGEYIENMHASLREQSDIVVDYKKQISNAIALLEDERRSNKEVRLKADNSFAQQVQLNAEQRKKDLLIVDGLTHHRHLLLEEVAELKKEVDALEMRAKTAEDKVSALLGSRTWRAGSPLRWAGQRLRNIRTLLRISRILANDPAKILPGLRLVVKEVRVNGLRSLRSTLSKAANGGKGFSIPNLVSYRMTEDVAHALEKKLGSWVKKPKISILMPTYNTSSDALVSAIESVRSQFYKNWELCISDDCSSELRIRTILEAYAKYDSRIKVLFAKENAGVSSATNRALKAATGEYVVLLDHDDLLEPQALFRVAEAVIEDAPDFIYSDEVIVDANDEVVLGFALRPQFSLEYLRSHPYIVHLIAFRASFINALGGLDKKLTISQDYDLILRAAERAKKITHIPEVLYRWRTQDNSAGHQLKDRVMEASREILSRHLVRTKTPGHVELSTAFNFFEMRYPLQGSLRVAIVIPTKNHGQLVRQCIESIERTVVGIDYHIVLVDHDSTDEESLAYFDSLQDRCTVLRYSGSFNFSTINNWAVSNIGADFSHYLFCNNDIEAIEEGWLNRMLELGQRPNVGVVGAKLLYPDRLLCQHGGVGIGLYGAAEHYGKFMKVVAPDGVLEQGYMGALIANREMSSVTAACMLVRSDTFKAVNGYDEDLAVGFGDVDLCLRIRKIDSLVIFCAHAVLIHHESLSRGKSDTDPHPEDSALFRSRWIDFIDQGDPYFNPGLSLTSTRWDLKEGMAPEQKISRRSVGCQF